MLTYKNFDKLQAVGYSDSVGCLDDRKSTFDSSFMMVGEAIYGKRFKQNSYSYFYHEGRVCCLL